MQFSNMVLIGKTTVNGLQLEDMMELMSLEEVSSSCLAVNMTFLIHN